MKGTSKGSGKPTSATWGSSVETEVLYNSRGEPVKAYRLVEEESGVGEGYEGDQEQQDAQQQYEYPGSGRQWLSWADAADWQEQHGDSATMARTTRRSRVEIVGRVQRARAKVKQFVVLVRALRRFGLCRRRRRRTCTTTSGIRP